jgi:hypothetical protein
LSEQLNTQKGFKRINCGMDKKVSIPWKRIFCFLFPFIIIIIYCAEKYRALKQRNNESGMTNDMLMVMYNDLNCYNRIPVIRIRKSKTISINDLKF